MFACDIPAEHGYCTIRGLDEKPLPKPSALRTDRHTKAFEQKKSASLLIRFDADCQCIDTCNLMIHVD